MSLLTAKSLRAYMFINIQKLIYVSLSRPVCSLNGNEFDDIKWVQAGSCQIGYDLAVIDGDKCACPW